MASVEPEGLKGPTPPQPSVADIILAQLAELRDRQDQLAAHMAKLAEVKTPQGNQAGENPKGGFGDIMDVVNKGLDAWNKFKGTEQGSGPNTFFFDLYRKAHENYDQKVLMPGLTRIAGVEMKPSGARVEP